KKREQSGFSFHIVLSLRFYRKFRICLTNASGYAHTPIINSPIRTSPILVGAFLFTNDLSPKEMAGECHYSFH
ncbi:MAG: hypothetical protein IJW98_02465, partial [Clostridia bacterium]|nr:hypothetical protein [Clostridia bacterium]